MILSYEDGELFYELWLPLLDYVNKKYKVAPELGDIRKDRPMDANTATQVAKKLWENKDVIDEYVALHGELEEDHREILLSWKRARTDKYILERHLKTGSIFIGTNETVFKVVGIKSSWEEMFAFFKPPIFMEATLIPFRDVIISDGLVRAFPIHFGGNISREYKDVYMRAKKSGRLYTFL